jgi:putative oxidoreductase
MDLVDFDQEVFERIQDEFGEFLSGQGFPLGELLAWSLTLFEIVGAPLLAMGIAASPLALLFSAELLAGIVLVHRHAGWFVVGGGRNGVEYSLCLILALIACVLSERRAGWTGSAPPRG